MRGVVGVGVQADVRSGAPLPPLGPGLHASTVAVALVLIVATVATLIGARHTVRADGARLLRERTNEVVSVLNTSITGLSQGLQTVGQVALATDAAARPFQITASAAAAGQPGTSFSLLRSTPSGWNVELTTGTALHPGELVTGARAATFDRALHTQLAVATPVLGTGVGRRFGVALGPPGTPPGTVVYREAALGPLGPPKQATTAPFQELNVVLYAGTAPVSSTALVSTASSLPLHGSTQHQFLTIGESKLLIVVAARSPLVGRFTAAAPWLVLGIGLVLTALISFLVEQAVRRRDDAIARYAAQRNVAETLQRSLLPDITPLAGLDVASRYLPGAAEQRIGGDWFDCFRAGTEPSGDDRVAVVIGDVMGHDMQAAAAMAQVRAAIRAYMCEDNGPARTLERLSHLVDLLEVAPLVSVFCGVLGAPDGAGDRVLRYANGGHPPPLVHLADGTVCPLDQAASTIIGAPHAGGRSEADLVLPAGSSLLLFTDGLVEEPGRPLGDALESVAASLATIDPGASAEATCGVIESLAGPLRDDVAILVLRTVPVPIPDPPAAVVRSTVVAGPGA